MFNYSNKCLVHFFFVCTIFVSEKIRNKPTEKTACINFMQFCGCTVRLQNIYIWLWYIARYQYFSAFPSKRNNYTYIEKGENLSGAAVWPCAERPVWLLVVTLGCILLLRWLTESSCSTGPCLWSCHLPKVRSPEQLKCCVELSAKTTQFFPVLQYHFPVRMHELSNVHGCCLQLVKLHWEWQTAMEEDME